jgi:chromosome partitioning protein
VSLAARTARIIAIANQKGGVGKSTTSVSLGASLAELGKRVLVVDLDPQGNASTGLGIRHEARDVTVYDVLAAEAAIEGAIVPTLVDGLFAIPSTIDLAGAEIELVSQFSRELRLRKALEPLESGKDAFDFILLDCPPSLGLLTVNALAAARELIVPIQTEYYALEGLGQLLRNVRLVQQNVNPGLTLTGIVMTMYDPRTKLSEQVVQEVRRYFGDRVYDTIIPRTVRLSEAPGFGQPITVYDPKSRGAQCYRDLAKEVAEKIRPAEPLPMMDDLPSVVVAPRDPAETPDMPVTATAARAPRPLVRQELAEPEDHVPATAGRADGEDVAATQTVREVKGSGSSAPPAEPVNVEPIDEVEPPAEATEATAGVDDVAEANGHASVESVGLTTATAASDRRAGGASAQPDVESGRIDGPPGGDDVDVTDAFGEPDVDDGLDEPTPDQPSSGTPTVAAPRHEAGRVVLIDEQPVIEEPRPMPQPDDNGEASGKRRRRLFRRGGDR